jgi:putative transcriptional regulator
MATVRMTLEEAAAAGDVDRAMLHATTEEDIRQHQVEDGFDPDDPMAGLVEILSPAEIRHRAGLTQAQMAERLRIPVATWRNWEQGRTALDPATRSFLNIVANDTERTFRAIAGRAVSDHLDGQLDALMQMGDAQFLIAYARTIADRPERGSRPEVPTPNGHARLQRLRRDPDYGPVVALLDKMVGL